MKMSDDLVRMTAVCFRVKTQETYPTENCALIYLHIILWNLEKNGEVAPTLKVCAEHYLVVHVLALKYCTGKQKFRLQLSSLTFSAPHIDTLLHSRNPSTVTTISHHVRKKTVNTYF